MTTKGISRRTEGADAIAIIKRLPLINKEPGDLKDAKSFTFTLTDKLTSSKGVGKMEAVLLLLLITIAGSSGAGIFDHCNLSRCRSLSPEDFRRVLRDFPPDEGELKVICSPLLETVDCFTDFIPECTGESLEDYASSENKTVAQYAYMIINAFSLVTEMCDEESQFRKDMIDNAACLKQVIASDNRDCRKKSNRLYDIFKLPESLEVEDDDSMPTEGMISEAHCLTRALEGACILKEMQKSCGETAKNVMLEIINRPKLLKVGICSENDLLTLKGDFLDFLEEQGEHREFLSSMFDIRGAHT